jgi:CubicO group peptidase (beta-lactamase class C family)
MRVLSCLLLALLLPASTLARSPREAADALRQFLDGVPTLGPGYAVVVVDRDEHLLDYVRGQRNAASGAPLTLDTPIYIASQTKSYLGLLAHILDRRGVLRLDSTLAEHWPQLRLPGGLDPKAWTLADLLNHRVPIDAEALVVLEAYIGAPADVDYPALLAATATAREPGFQYDNLGYNVYAAILFAKTGKRWQDWLRDELFVPLGMKHTSARTSDFAVGDLAMSHSWLGESDGWEVVPPKADAIMQSAGGLVSSPNDVARWLQLQLGGTAPNAFSTALLAKAQHKGAEVDPKARNAYELPCDGYAFGWNLCDFEGHRLYIHGGGYTGARTLMAFAPDLGVGIAAFSNSDNMTGWFTSRTVVQFLQYLTDHAEADEWAKTRTQLYPERVAENLAARRKAVTDTRADAQWSGWSWRPEATVLAEYTGDYRGVVLPVDARLTLEKGALELRIGALQRRLEAAVPDLFGATRWRLDTPQPLRFQRDDAGRVVGFEFDGQAYRRANSDSRSR